MLYILHKIDNHDMHNIKICKTHRIYYYITIFNWKAIKVEKNTISDESTDAYPACIGKNKHPVELDNVWFAW